ncbi:MAG: nucleotidyltransferase family protein [Burkholderiaceae bacterium]
MAWLQALRDPQQVTNWTLADWERVVRLGRRLRLLARLTERLAAADLLDQVPPQPPRHLVSEQRLSQWRTHAMVWVLERVATTLRGIDYPLVLLKGGAYIGQDLPIARGRLPSDVDILVPKAHIADAQARLGTAGWITTTLDEHDQRYYHEWSHEVPPMSHPLHGVELDLHHNIQPPVARMTVDAAALLQRIKPSIWTAWHVLDPLDQILHSAVHLFQDSDIRDRLRDLVDLDGLIRYFSEQLPHFWTDLPARAAELGLSEPLALACHFCQRWLLTPIPDDALSTIESAGPSRLKRAWLLPLLEQVLTPTEPDADPATTQGVAATMLLARHHYGRMPLRLLIPHTWHKMRAARNFKEPVQPQ